jgi:kumamolisin
MATSKKRVTLPDSRKKALRNAKVTGSVDPEARIEITVVLRPRIAGKRANAKSASEMIDAPPLAELRRQGREEFEAVRGADPMDVRAIEDFAHEHGLTVVEASLPKRSIRLAGTVKDLTAAFEPKMKKVKLRGRSLRMRIGGISVPTELAPMIVAVLGFDDRPAARPHLRFSGRDRRTAKTSAKRLPRNAADGGFTPLDIARLYGFPAALTGKGQCIGIIELNDFQSTGRVKQAISAGFSANELNAYFSSLGIASPPKAVAVGVASDGTCGANLPHVDSLADGEVMLDIEVAGAVAPDASIAVYFGLNTDNGFLAAFNAALHDDVRRPSVISISWGSSEDSNTRQFLVAFDEA